MTLKYTKNRAKGYSVTIGGITLLFVFRSQMTPSKLQRASKKSTFGLYKFLIAIIL